MGSLYNGYIQAFVLRMISVEKLARYGVCTVGVQKYLLPPNAASITAFHFDLFCLPQRVYTQFDSIPILSNMPKWRVLGSFHLLFVLESVSCMILDGAISAYIHNILRYLYLLLDTLSRSRINAMISNPYHEVAA